MKPVLFILLGQSNAVGHDLPMAEEEKRLEPMKNVFGLDRGDNQSLELTQLHWQGYTSGGMNLGEEQDHTWSVANCLACQWQTAIDRGCKLPDLYIVQIAIGAQGVTEEYMWYPDRKPRLVPGVLGQVDISLHPLTTHILSLMPRSFDRCLLHWRGGENDMTVNSALLRNQLPDLYRRLIADWQAALGVELPVVLHKLICGERAMDMDPSGEYLKSMAVINETFETLAEELRSVSVFDPKACPLYEPETRQHNIFLEDAVHFTAQVNHWVASEVMNTLTK